VLLRKALMFSHVVILLFKRHTTRRLPGSTTAILVVWYANGQTLITTE